MVKKKEPRGTGVIYTRLKKLTEGDGGGSGNWVDLDREYAYRPGDRKKKDEQSIIEELTWNVN